MESQEALDSPARTDLRDLLEMPERMDSLVPLDSQQSKDPSERPEPEVVLLV